MELLAIKPANSGNSKTHFIVSKTFHSTSVGTEIEMCTLKRRYFTLFLFCVIFLFCCENDY